MKHLYTAFLALLIVGSAGLVVSSRAQAQDGYRYDSGCNCHVPIHSRSTVREAPRYVSGSQRQVNDRRVVTRYRTENRNHLVEHIRPVIRRDVVIHRHHVHYQNIVTVRRNTINRYREEARYGGIENREGGTTTSSNTVYRYVRGSTFNQGGNCDCDIAPSRSTVSYRD